MVMSQQKGKLPYFHFKALEKQTDEYLSSRKDD